MTSTTPKSHTTYFDIELTLTDDQLKAAGNLSSSFPAPFHCNLFHKQEFSLRCLLRCLARFLQANVCSFLYTCIDNYVNSGQETPSLSNNLRVLYISAFNLAAVKLQKATAA